MTDLQFWRLAWLQAFGSYLAAQEAADDVVMELDAESGVQHESTARDFDRAAEDAWETVSEAMKRWPQKDDLTTMGAWTRQRRRK